MDAAKEVSPYACSVSEDFSTASAINYCQRKETGLNELIISSKAAVLKKNTAISCLKSSQHMKQEKKNGKALFKRNWC